MGLTSTKAPRALRAVGVMLEAFPSLPPEAPEAQPLDFITANGVALPEPNRLGVAGAVFELFLVSAGSACP